MRTWVSPLGPAFAADWVVYSFVIGGLMLDLLVVPLLLWPRTRPFAFVAAVGFNLINAVIFDIGIFPWLMLGALLIFFPPDLLRRFARAFMSPGESFRDVDQPEVPVTSDTPGGSLNTSNKLVVGVLADVILVTIVIPLTISLTLVDLN